MEKQLRSSIFLILTATIWGTAFVAQSVGMEHVEPLTFNAVRCLIGGLFLIPCMTLLKKMNAGDQHAVEKNVTKNVLVAGILCGVVFTLASNLQAYGVKYTTVGKAGFITSSYIVIVPILGVFLKKKVAMRIWIAVAIALVGLYLLCMGETLLINAGDLLIFMSAVMFSIHILVIDHFAPHVDGVLMSCIQFIVCGILTMIPALIFENSMMELFNVTGSLLYAGVFSCGIAYTLQVIGQKNMNPTIAALILSLESCISVLAGWVFLGEVLSIREGIGCCLMFLAIIIAQLPIKKENIKSSS